MMKLILLTRSGWSLLKPLSLFWCGLICFGLGLAAQAQPGPKKPLRALLITGGCCHDYEQQKKIITEGVSARANVTWDVVHEGGSSTRHKVSIYEKSDWAEGYDVVVHNECFADVKEVDWAERILKPHRAGVPAVVLHCAMHSYRISTDEWFKFLGVTSHRHGSHFPHEVKNLQPAHPIMKGFPASWQTPREELYNIEKVWPTATALGHSHSHETKRDETCIWINTYGQGRVFGTTIGHYNHTMEHPVYLDLITRGLLWAAGKLADNGQPQPGYASVQTKAPGGENGVTPPPPGFTALFNGKDLTGWYGLGHFDPRKLWAMSDEERAKKKTADMQAFKKHWQVENGELVNDGDGPYATTEKEYGDIELLIDYKTVAKADSGIYLRANPQVQIWDYTKEGGKWNIGADKGSGGLWNNSAGAPGKDPLVLADKPFGEWNRFRIIQVGDRTTIYLNGKLVVDHAVMENFWDRKKPLWAQGPIQLQTHGGEIRWRNIFIREIPPEEANKILQKRADAGFKPVFNGKDFTGWAGPLDNYEVKDGALVCKPGKGGTIYTKEQYSDFVVRFEFKLPPGGNNGLAIRYPGSGDTAYAGMCELQVLDDTADKYAKLDPRQYHGSAYGMVAAHRGFLRPVGEWNFQEVTVKGSTIKVDLNGVTILDADLSKVNQFMSKNPHPGKDRTSGHFGFAGHNDPVEFRNIRIKTLDY